MDPLASGRSSMQPCHVSLGFGFVQKHQFAGIEAVDHVGKGISLGLDVGTFAFGVANRFGFSSLFESCESPGDRTGGRLKFAVLSDLKDRRIRLLGQQCRNFGFLCLADRASAATGVSPRLDRSLLALLSLQMLNLSLTDVK